MARRNLSKTAIEGGRIEGYKYERKCSLRTQRRMSKSTIQGVRDLDEYADLELPDRKLSSYYPGEKFKDKLSPVYRWLDKKVGKSWNKVFAKMKQEFDDRTTPGRHIMYDHMLSQIWVSPDRSTTLAKYYSYFVDGHGILRKAPDYLQDRNQEYHKSIKEREAIGIWLAGRFIGKIGNVLYWYEPTRPIPNPIKFSWDWMGPKYIYQMQSRDPKSWYQWMVPYRQGTRLLGKDVEFFSKLTDLSKDWLLSHSPQHKKLYDEPFGRF